MVPSENNSKSSRLSKRRLMPVAYYSNPDRVFVGVDFRISKGRLSDSITKFEHSIRLRYSISQNAFSLLYDARWKELIGKWNMAFNAYYDWVVWTNFTGLGNETPRVADRDYYRLSTSEYAANISINRLIDKHHYVDIAAFMQSIEVINKPGTFVEQNYTNNKDYYFDHHIYTSLRAGYTYQNVDDHVIPTRGFMAYGGARYTVNTYQPYKNFAKLSGILQGYIPLSNKFSLSLRAGAGTVIGTPEFYQYEPVGGPMTIRGYFRNRFWGNTMFYNSNEIRWITDLRVKRFENKVGLVALFDNGRVWLDGEHSNKLHYGYGAGVLVAPMRKFTAYATYTLSEEGGLIQFKLTKLLSTYPASRSPF
jgi:outer membrane protein assembly factor BamA